MSRGDKIMEKNIKRNYLLLKTLYCVRYYGDAMFYGFFQLYLASIGLSNNNIGMILAIIPLTTLFVNPFWSVISKNVNINKKIIQLTTIVEGVLIIAFGQLSGIEVLAVLMFVISMIYIPFYSLLDGFCGTFCDQSQKEYPKIRLLGSLSFAISIAVAGVIISNYGYSVAFIISGIIMIICSLIIKLIKPLDLTIGLEDSQVMKRDYKALFKNMHFILYVFFYLFTYVITLIGDSYLSIYLTQERGFSASLYGWLYSAFVLIEVLTIWFVNKFCQKCNFSRLIVTAGFMFALKYIMIGINAPVYLVICGTLFRGVCWGIILTVNIRYLIRVVQLRNLTLAVFTLSIFQSLFQSIFYLFGGRVIQAFGFSKFYLILSICAATTTVLYFIALRILKFIKKHNKGKKNDLAAAN